MDSIWYSLWWNAILQLIVPGSMSAHSNPETTGTIVQKPTSTENIKWKVAGLFGDIDGDANLIMIAQK